MRWEIDGVVDIYGDCRFVSFVSFVSRTVDIRVRSEYSVGVFLFRLFCCFFWKDVDFRG